MFVTTYGYILYNQRCCGCAEKFRHISDTTYHGAFNTEVVADYEIAFDATVDEEGGGIAAPNNGHAAYLCNVNFMNKRTSSA